MQYIQGVYCLSEDCAPVHPSLSTTYYCMDVAAKLIPKVARCVSSVSLVVGVLSTRVFVFFPTQHYARHLSFSESPNAVDLMPSVERLQFQPVKYVLHKVAT